MLSFSVDFKPGLPLAEQVVFAVKKAVVAGQLRPGGASVWLRRLRHCGRGRL